MIKKNKLDIETLEYVKFHFELYSDATPKTHGYKWLCKNIMRHSSINNMECYNCGYRTSNI